MCLWSLESMQFLFSFDKLCCCDLLHSVLELSTCLCGFSFFKEKNRAQNTMDLQFAAYQIFSSIWVEGYGKGRETAIAGIFSSCYIVLVVYKLSKCH